MKRVTDKLKPVNGFSHILHLFLTVLLPLVVYVLVRLNLVQLAILIIILSKVAHVFSTASLLAGNHPR